MALSVPGDLLDRKECVHYFYVGKDVMVAEKNALKTNTCTLI